MFTEITFDVIVATFDREKPERTINYRTSQQSKVSLSSAK